MIGTSGRIWVAMWITAVPSTWNADAIATRSNPPSSSTQRTTSRGCACSNLRLSVASSPGGRRVCKAASIRWEDGSARVGVPYAWRSRTPRIDVTSYEPLLETIEPHGGTLVNLIVAGAERQQLVADAVDLPKVVVSERELSDLELLAVGALSPLTGFPGEEDYNSVLETMHLSDGLPWSIPVTLSLHDEDVKRIVGADRIALVRRESGEALAVLEGAEVFSRDRRKEAISVFRTEDAEHPGVAALLAAGDRCAAGRLRVLELPRHEDFIEYRLTPAQTRAEFQSRGWRTVVGFQTRNPIHRAHEYLQKCALEIVDGLLVHPLVGATKGDDVPSDVRMRCYEALFEGYYPKDRAMISVFPAAMRYAGPKEAIWHAIARKNYGCTHFIVGRDHAGVGTYYGTYDA